MVLRLVSTRQLLWPCLQTSRAAQDPVDLVAVLFGTLTSDLLTNADLEGCFKCSAAVLAEGGLIVLEFDAASSLTSGEWHAPDAWGIQLDGKDAVSLSVVAHMSCAPTPCLTRPCGQVVEYGTENDTYHPIDQVRLCIQAKASPALPCFPLLLTMAGLPQWQDRHIVVKELQRGVPSGRPRKGQGMPREVVRHSFVARHRLWTIQELLLVAEKCALEVCALFGDLSRDVAVDNPQAERTVIFLRRRS